MKSVGYYNGKMGPLEEMTIPMNDRAVYFGDGVYDAAYAVNRKIYALEEHLTRFYESAALLELPFETSKEELRAALQACVDAVESDGEVFVYWQTSRGIGIRSHVFPEAGKANLLIYVTPKNLRDIFEPYHCITLEDKRFLMCNIKSLNLIPAVLANQRAMEAGCDEAILHRGDRVTECAHSNVSILKDGVLRTAPADHLILPGVARAHLIEAAKTLGIPVAEEPYTMKELFDADEILVTASGAICAYVTQLDGKEVGGKDATHRKELQNYLADQIEKEVGSVLYRRR